MKKIKIFTTCFSAAILFSFQVQAQKAKIAENIQNVVSAAKNKQMISADDFVFEKDNISTTLNEASKYINDSIVLCRNQVFVIIQKAGRLSKSEPEQTTAVNLLSTGCMDKNVGIAMYCSKSLQAFARNSFSAQARENIGKSFQENPKNYTNTAQLIGYLNLSDYIPAMQSALSDSKTRKKDAWYINLAMARMGDKKSVKYCKQIYESQKLGSEVVVEMFPDLLYTRNREFYDEIIKILYSDKKDCTSGNPDNEKSILCGYIVMEELAPYIKNYPLETHASGDIKTDDYDKSLEKLRKWFEKNEYVILDDSF